MRSMRAAQEFVLRSYVMLCKAHYEQTFVVVFTNAGQHRDAQHSRDLIAFFIDKARRFFQFAVSQAAKGNHPVYVPSAYVPLFKTYIPEIFSIQCV